MSALNRTLSVGVRGISNSVLNRALSISFEITISGEWFDDEMKMYEKGMKIIML